MTTDPTTTARLKVEAVNFDCADPTRLGSFWAAALGGKVTYDEGGFVIVSPPETGGVTLYFQRVPQDRPARNSLHLDLGTPVGAREAEAQRLIGLGATRQYDITGEVPTVDWATLADPEGNLFCVGSPPE
jgi:hypothetical protein